MKTVSLSEALKKSTYPGRGIIFGLTLDNKYAAIAYFIMGRSENSRNRIFVTYPDGSVKTKAFDESKMTDPSLIIYSPVRTPEKGVWVVTNGDQTDTICDFIEKGDSFENALRTRTFEPDSPNYTPRISGILSVKGGSLSYKLGILKCGDLEGKTTERQFFEYAEPRRGRGHFLHTYLGDGNPIPAFEGEPEWVSIPDTCERFTDEIWQNLNYVNKVSLYTAYIDIESGEAVSYGVINKNH